MSSSMSNLYATANMLSSGRVTILTESYKLPHGTCWNIKLCLFVFKLSKLVSGIDSH
jgi:hypothetical protein